MDDLSEAATQWNSPDIARGLNPIDCDDRRKCQIPAAWEVVVDKWLECHTILRDRWARPKGEGSYQCGGSDDDDRRWVRIPSRTNMLHRISLDSGRVEIWRGGSTFWLTVSSVCSRSCPTLFPFRQTTPKRWIPRLDGERRAVGDISVTKSATRFPA